MAEIELLTLANHAEAVGGLLYVSGAGWDVVTRAYPRDVGPNPHHFGIAVSVLVGWNETEQPHKLQLSIENEDGNVLWSLQGNLEMQRPGSAIPGADLRAALAIMLSFTFPQAGGYRVVAELPGKRRSYSFRVVDQVT